MGHELSGVEKLGIPAVLVAGLDILPPAHTKPFAVRKMSMSVSFSNRYI